MFCLFISTANPRSKALSARRFPIPACGTRAQPRFMYDAIQQNYLVNITIHQYAPLSPVFRLFSTTFCPPSQRAYWERPIPSSGVMLMTKLTILKNIISMGFFKAWIGAFDTFVLHRPPHRHLPAGEIAVERGHIIEEKTELAYWASVQDILTH